jgi:DNA-binding NtrC family response regulator
LVVDDEQSIREFLTILLEKEGYEVATAESVETATDRLGSDSFDLVMCDLKLPDGNGLEVLSTARRRRIESPFIIITAHTTPQHAIESLRAGAAEYLSKPFNVDDLKIILDKLLDEVNGEARPFEVPEFIGSSPPIQRILDLIPRVASTPSTVLITGESGTGKELLARAIHAHSPQAKGPFLSVNCGALPEGLLESELFGHAKGSFTGAVRDHVGLFEQASGGIIFLDEIGELSPPTQVKLLRVLQEHRVRPVGGQKEIEVEVRVLAATNRDLEKDVADGGFREDLYYRLNVLHLHLPDLYYRLNVLHLHLPGLRHRGDDIPELARHFTSRTCDRFEIPAKRLTPDAIRVLQAYSWPGNVRELENVIERTVALEQSEIISSGSLPEHLRGAAGSEPIEQVGLPEEGIDLEEYLNSLRLSMMRQALDKTGGHQKKAAELLRLSYRAFRYHADKLGLIRDEEGGS